MVITSNMWLALGTSVLLCLTIVLIVGFGRYTAMDMTIINYVFFFMMYISLELIEIKKLLKRKIKKG